MTYNYTIETEHDYEYQKYIENKAFKFVRTQSLTLNLSQPHYVFQNLFVNAESIHSTHSSLMVCYPKFAIKFHDWDRMATYEKPSYRYSVRVVGESPDVDFLNETLKELIVPDTNFISWAFNTSQGINTIETSVKYNGEVKNEFYPFLKDAKGFMDDYLKSKASVLILNGHRGTGKSTLISDFIVRHKLKSLTTYDSNLMKEDAFFIKFLTEEYDLLVLEDADLLLQSRLETNNETMAKLLNVSDGIVDMSKKKIIITANIDNRNNIDPAIMRPGRCYAFIDFRQLEGQEVDAACLVMNKKRPGTNKTYSLAECFHEVEDTQKEKFGF